MAALNNQTVWLLVTWSIVILTYSILVPFVYFAILVSLLLGLMHFTHVDTYSRDPKAIEHGAPMGKDWVPKHPYSSREIDCIILHSSFLPPTV